MRLKVIMTIAAATLTAILVGPTAAQRQPFGGPNLPQPDAGSSAANVPWATKAALLDAARNGEFRGLPDIRVNMAEQTMQLTESVFQILRNEYGVPPVPGSSSGGFGTCRASADSEVRRLLTAITALSVQTLSDKPPTFLRDINSAQYQQDIRMQMSRLGEGGGYCKTRAMGMEKPHPYGAALAELAVEFDKATTEFVEAERARRVASYQAEQTRIRSEQTAQAERQRAAEQQRIDAERARIEADQQRRQQAKPRISG